MKISTGFFVGLLLGLGTPGQATVPCGSFDRTDLEVQSVTRDGAPLPLPTGRTAYVMSVEPFGELYDPDTGALRHVILQQVRP